MLRDEIKVDFLALDGSPPVKWRIQDGLTPYEDALSFMESQVTKISNGESGELIWLVEHPPLYTAGTSANSEDLVSPDRFDVYQTGRGGEYTYHGPGQRVAYVMLDLKRRKKDVRAFISALEAWIIGTLAEMNVLGERREERVGVWVQRPEKARLPDGRINEEKIAAIGIRLRKWVSFHGIAINVEPDLEHFSGIIPCGVQKYGVTSLVDLGLPVTMMDLDIHLKTAFEEIFGPVKTD